MLESLGTDLTSWEIGPYHGSLPAAMRIRLRLDGEVIIGAEVETGYLHRGLEKSFESHSWQSSIVYADRLDPESAISGELCFCLAVENLAGIEVPARAQAIRVVVAELGRICSHLSYVVRMAKSVGAETLIHYVLRDREKILDLFELLTGARFSLGFLRFGGVNADVTEGFLERVLEACDLIRMRLKEYNDIFTFNQPFLKRTASVGVIPWQWVHELGVTGPNARATGIAKDIRRARAYCGYEKIDFEVPVGRGEGGSLGDTHDRFLIRLREISQCIEILKQAVDSMPTGPFAAMRIERDYRAPVGEAYASVESPRGLLGCHVVSDGGEQPARVQFRAPSLFHLSLVPRMAQGIRIEDLPVVLASLDLGIAEADR